MERDPAGEGSSTFDLFVLYDMHEPVRAALSVCWCILLHNFHQMKPSNRHWAAIRHSTIARGWGECRGNAGKEWSDVASGLGIDSGSVKSGKQRLSQNILS